jgi:diguanylate cyclase (GGDEF)-like protein
MQRHERLRRCPVVMLTAHTDAAEVAAALDGGAQDYLRKPSEPVEIVARVRKALNLQHREKVLRRRAEELGEISSHDPLTGLGNRRLMTQWLADRTVPGARLGAFLVDIDRFKQVNDTEGHLVGDRVLIQMAARLVAVTEAEQLLVRWGGEEFLVLVMDPQEGALTSTAAKIWRAIGDRPFDVGSGRALAVTVSVGVATGALDELGDVLQRADQALYEAKDSGRDRYVIAD